MSTKIHDANNLSLSKQKEYEEKEARECEELSSKMPSPVLKKARVNNNAS